MRLVDNSEDLKLHNSAIQKDLKIESVRSFVDDAEQNMIVPAIGMEMYSRLLGTDPQWDKDVALKGYLQKAIVNFTVSNYIAFGSIQLSDGGAHVIQDERKKIASDKKLLVLRKHSRADAFRALEFAVEYLESNLSYFTDYAGSAAHQNNRRFLINTTADFSIGFDIRGNAGLFDSLKAVMGNVEENYISQLLGPVVETALRAAVTANNTTAIQKQLLNKIYKAVAPITIAEGIPYRLIEIDEQGVLAPGIVGGGTSDNVETAATASTNQLAATMGRAMQQGKNRLATLRTWLNANATAFPGFTLINENPSATLNGSGSPNLYFV